MEFTKSALTFDEQVALLQSRGFDRELRLLAMDAIERFEVAVRTRVAYEHAHAGGPFGYATDVRAVYAGREAERRRFFEQLDDSLRKNRHEQFVKHFAQMYGDAHRHPPIWVAVEVLMFGDVVRLFSASPHAIQRRVADHFGVAARVMKSWLLALNVVRNLCAHHMRLWNREFGVKPMIPRTGDWTAGVEIEPDRVFAVLTILADIMRCVAPGSEWATRVRSLIERQTHVPLKMMGFPEAWTSSLIWRRAWNPTHSPR